MTTALNIIKKAMLKAGIIVKQEVPDSDEAADALSELNRLMDSLSNESMVITARTREAFPLTGAMSYTIGSGGDFDTVRPTYIIEAHVTNAGLTYPMGVITDEVYERIGIKNLSGIPEFYNYTNGFPLGKIYIWPIGDATYTLHLLTEKPLTQFPELTTVIDLPPGWENLLIYNLAVLLCPEYGQPISPELDNLAKQFKRDIQLANIKSRSLDAYPQNIYTSNIYSGWMT